MFFLKTMLFDLMVPHARVFFPPTNPKQGWTCVKIVHENVIASAKKRKLKQCHDRWPWSAFLHEQNKFHV